MLDNTKVTIPALFMHIQKTAGTSIVDLARAFYGSNNVVSHGDYLDGWSGQDVDLIVDARGKEPEDFRDVAFVSGHFGYDFARMLMKGRYSFVFLRDPIERILSFYYFCRSRNPHEFKMYSLAHEHDLEEFLSLSLRDKGLKACIWNHQCWQLAHGYGHLDDRDITKFTDEEILDLALQHLNQFSYFGFMETFENDCDVILKALGIPLPEEKVISNANPGRPISGDLPSSTIALLQDLTRLDSALYQEAWSRRASFLINRSAAGLENI